MARDESRKQLNEERGIKNQMAHSLQHFWTAYQSVSTSRTENKSTITLRNIRQEYAGRHRQNSSENCNRSGGGINVRFIAVQWICSSD